MKIILSKKEASQFNTLIELTEAREVVTETLKHYKDGVFCKDTDSEGNVTLQISEDYTCEVNSKINKYVVMILPMIKSFIGVCKNFFEELSDVDNKYLKSEEERASEKEATDK